MPNLARYRGIDWLNTSYSVSFGLVYALPCRIWTDCRTAFSTASITVHFVYSKWVAFVLMLVCWEGWADENEYTCTWLCCVVLCCVVLCCVVLCCVVLCCVVLCCVVLCCVRVITLSYHADVSTSETALRVIVIMFTDTYLHIVRVWSGSCITKTVWQRMKKAGLRLSREKQQTNKNWKPKGCTRLITEGHSDRLTYSLLSW